MMEWLRELILDVVFGIDTESLSGCLAVVSSLYIPVAVLIYEELKDGHAFNDFEWDKIVLLKRVIRGWQVLGSILISSISIIFWNCQIIWSKLFFLSLFILGIVVLTINLIRLFRWFVSNKIGNTKKDNFRQKQKMKFLRHLDPNNSMDVWSDLFSHIEKENAYLKDYLEVFFKKLSKANKDSYWQYEMCLSRNMSRLYYENPDFQNAVMDFAFDAYVKQSNKDREINYIKRSLVRKLIGLLAQNEGRCYFSVSETFNKKLADLGSDDIVRKCVEEYSFDVLNEILSVYEKIPEKNDCYSLEVFPTWKWNIASLPTSNEVRENAKAVGLFITYLKIMPSYVRDRNGEINEKRGEFLDNVVFGLFGQKLSRKMIRIVNLYFSQNFFVSYDGEGDDHALIRNFIDNNYHFYFLESGCSIASNYDPNESEEQRTKRLMAAFKAEADKRNDDTLKLLTSVYRFLLKTDALKKLKKELSRYDLKDEKYKYKTDSRIVEDNLAELKNVINIIIKYGEKE